MTSRPSRATLRRPATGAPTVATLNVRESTRVRVTTRVPMVIALEDDNLLFEILLRLPPLPSSLPRASAVCKRWRGLVTDPRFLSSFCDHHGKEGPPILGFFVKDYPEHYEVVVFHPILDRPDSVPLSIDFGHCTMLGCRDGRVLIVDGESWELVVCTPITGEQQRVPIPTEFDGGCFMGSVMCAAGDLGHVHGTCHSGPFMVVLVSAYDEEKIACVYFSETGAWGNLISTVGPRQVFESGCPGLLVGKTLYWLSEADTIIEFDLEEESLAVLTVPPGTGELRSRQIILAEDGAIGFAVFSYPHFQMWQRNTNCRGIGTWVPWKTIQMHTILGLPPQLELPIMKTILCYDEDTDTIFLSVDENVYMVQLKSMQSKRLYTTEDIYGFYHFKSFYPPGTSITGGGAEVLHDR